MRTGVHGWPHGVHSQLVAIRWTFEPGRINCGALISGSAKMLVWSVREVISEWTGKIVPKLVSCGIQNPYASYLGNYKASPSVGFITSAHFAAIYIQCFRNSVTFNNWAGSCRTASGIIFVKLYDWMQGKSFTILHGNFLLQQLASCRQRHAIYIHIYIYISAASDSAP